MQPVSSSENGINQYFFLFPSAMLLLPIVIMSFIISWVSSVPIYIIIGSVYLLMTSFHSANPHLLLLVAKIWSLFLWGFFLFFFLKSSQLWNHAVFFFIWFNFVIIVLSKSNCVATTGSISFSLWLSNTPLYMSQLLYPFTHQWTLR